MTRDDILNEASEWKHDYTVLCCGISEEFTEDYNRQLKALASTIEELNLDMSNNDNIDIVFQGIINYYLSHHNSDEPDAYFYSIVALVYFFEFCTQA